jgi:predicted dithiol-disulfide oxidoreductase (DUF899 family)
MQDRKIVSHEAWLAAREQLLAREKEFDRQRDELSEARRNLPWEKVEKSYVFEGPDGKETLPQLFGKCGQLVVYHFMFDPDWEAGCKSCSFWADNFDHIGPHLKARDISFLAVSRALYAKLAAYQKRMGWTFKWVSSFGSDFNFDYAVSFRPEDVARGQIYYNYGTRNMKMTEMVGISVFAKDDAGDVFHTYSTYARGVDMLNGAYHYIDLTPKGRDEGGKNQFWVRRHDEYPS